MKNRLEIIMESSCYGLPKWVPKNDTCKHFDKYNQIDCKFMNSKYCINNATQISHIKLYGTKNDLIKKN